MKAILVDDEPYMIRSFVRNSADISELEIVGSFTEPKEAVSYAENNKFDLAVLDIKMPGMDGIELAKRLRGLNPEVLIVFITAYDNFVRDSNTIGGDDYIVKPYKKETIERMVKKMRLLGRRNEKDIYIQMFGRFNVLKNGIPIKLQGKAKEILALIACRRGKEISNEELFTTIWEGREYSNDSMKMYFNALKRLKDHLSEYGIENLILSTARGQMLNMDVCSGDYFEWMNNTSDKKKSFNGEFLSEYSWGEYLLAELINPLV